MPEPLNPYLVVTEHTLKLCETDRQALALLVAESGESENMAIQTAIQNASMNTDARRRASAAYHAKRTDAGLKKVTLWLSPEAREVLDRVKDEVGSKDAAADEAIRAHFSRIVRSVRPSGDEATEEVAPQQKAQSGAVSGAGSEIGKPISGQPIEK